MLVLEYFAPTACYNLGLAWNKDAALGEVQQAQRQFFFYVALIEVQLQLVSHVALTEVQLQLLTLAIDLYSRGSL